MNLSDLPIPAFLNVRGGTGRESPAQEAARKALAPVLERLETLLTERLGDLDAMEAAAAATELSGDGEELRSLRRDLAYDLKDSLADYGSPEDDLVCGWVEDRFPSGDRRSCVELALLLGAEDRLREACGLPTLAVLDERDRILRATPLPARRPAKGP